MYIFLYKAYDVNGKFHKGKISADNEEDIRSYLRRINLSAVSVQKSYLIASSIKAIFSQRLIRKLCDKCKIELSTSIDNSLVDFDSSIKTYTAKGCSYCKNTGYKGRIALAESVIIDDALKKMIHEQRSENEMLKHISLKGDSIEFLIKRLLIDGVTSIEEIIRVNNFN